MGETRLGVVAADRVALRLRVDEQHAEDVSGHEEQDDHGNDVYEHLL
jgi:hypothetical protein